MQKRNTDGDSPEQIKKCLSCTKKKCNNCLDIRGADSTQRAQKKVKLPVKQIDKGTGEVIAVYGSVQEASIKTGVATSGISMALNGRKKSAGGYFWASVERI